MTIETKSGIADIFKAEVKMLGEELRESDAKFEIGKTYFVMDLRTFQTDTITVEARTAHMLTGTTAEGTRKYRVAENTKGEYVKIGKGDDDYGIYIYAKNEFTPANVEAAKKSCIEAAARLGINTGAETDGSEEDENDEPELLNADAFVNLYQSPYEEKHSNRTVKVGNDNLTFNRHRLIHIDSPNTFFEIHYTPSGRKQFLYDGRVIAREKIFTIMAQRELATKQSKTFAEFLDAYKQNRNGFFQAWVTVTFADNRNHRAIAHFDKFCDAKAYVAEARKIFAGMNPVAVIRHDCASNYYKLNKDGSETYNLPDIEFFKGYSKGEIQARIDATKKAIEDNDQAAKENAKCYIWTNLCTAIHRLRKTLRYYEFAIRQLDFDTPEETKNARMNALQAEIKAITAELLGDENITDTRDAYLRKNRIDARRELEALKAEAPTVEVDPEEYAISPEALDVATNAEIELASQKPTAEFPKGTVEVDNGADAFKLVAPYFPNGLTFAKASKYFNGEDKFTFVNPFESLFLTATCDKDNQRVELLEVIDTSASGSKRKPLIVYIKPVATLTEGQRLAAQIINSLGGLIIKFNFASFGEKGELVLHYGTFKDATDESSTPISLVETFTDKTNYILDRVNVIRDYDCGTQVSTYYFKAEDFAAADREIEIQDELERLEDELVTATIKKFDTRFGGDFKESQRWEREIAKINERRETLQTEWCALTERYVEDDTPDEPPPVAENVILLLFTFNTALDAKKILKPFADKAHVELGDLTLGNFDNDRKTCEVLAKVIGSTDAIEKFKALLSDRIIIDKATKTPNDNKTFQPQDTRRYRLNNILKFPCGGFNPVKHKGSLRDFKTRDEMIFGKFNPDKYHGGVRERRRFYRLHDNVLPV